MHILLSGSIRDSSLYNVLSLVLIFAFVLCLAYFATKLTAKLQGNPLNKKANIKIIDSYRLGGNKFISIVKIGTNYYALGFGKDEITFIDKLKVDSINLPDGFKNESIQNDSIQYEAVDIKNVDDNIDLDCVSSNSNKQSFKDILLSFTNKDNKEKKDNRDKK